MGHDAASRLHLATFSLAGAGAINICIFTLRGFCHYVWAIVRLPICQGGANTRTNRVCRSFWSTSASSTGAMKSSPLTRSNDEASYRMVNTVPFEGSSKFSSSELRVSSCDTPSDGYVCDANISHLWGQYSPWFRVQSEIPVEPPSECTVTFVQLLSRHGARNPTSGVSHSFNRTISGIKASVPSSALKGPYAFLATYTYTLGTENLTHFGEQEMVNLGTEFYKKYSFLSGEAGPFVRASGQARVIQSAINFTNGYARAGFDIKQKSGGGAHPDGILVIPEGHHSNSTLKHGHCPAYKSYRHIGETRAAFKAAFLPGIQSRLNSDLPDANLNFADIVNLMELCGFETVASPTGQPSGFCNLFSQEEWEAYDYFQTLGKYYGSGKGNPLGPTQGVGYVNELIARLTKSPVQDNTTVNHTLDADSTTFPLDRSVYADFSHDNLLVSVFAALDLYNITEPLDKTQAMSTHQLKGFSAGNTVPFAGRVIVEKLACRALKDMIEKVRVIMNGRVLPLEMCGGDALGLCTLDNFVNAQAFAKRGGNWADCAQNVSQSHTGLLYDPQVAVA